MFSEILLLWLNRYKFCQCLTKPIITQIIVSLVFKNVIVTTAVLFSEILSLVERDKILSLFNQAYYCTNFIVSLVLENVIITAAVLFSEIL